MAHLVTTAGEGIVLAICQKVPIRFGNMKVIFDATLVCIAVILSFLFLGHLDGVREGTIAAALFVGLITKQTNKFDKSYRTHLLTINFLCRLLIPE